MLPIAVCLLALSCDGLTDVSADTPPFAIEELTLREFSPSASYEVWWSEVEECSDRTRDIREIRFLEVLSPLSESRHQFPCFESGRWCSGVYSDSKIYIASGLVRNERLIKHEMLHAVFGGGGEDGSSLFLACT